MKLVIPSDSNLLALGPEDSCHPLLPPYGLSVRGEQLPSSQSKSLEIIFIIFVYMGRKSKVELLPHYLILLESRQYTN